MIKKEQALHNTDSTKATEEILLEREQALLNAVIIQAAYDYKKALIKEKLWHDKAADIAKFFEVETFALFSELDGIAIRDKIKQQVKDGDYSLPSHTYR